jgi:hypothetical protein
MSALPVRALATAPMPSPAVVAAADELIGYLPLEDAHRIAQRIASRLEYVICEAVAQERDEARALVGRWRSERLREWVSTVMEAS